MAPSVDTAAAVPERTHEQRMRALTRANEIRSKRAQLKRDLKAGKETQTWRGHLAYPSAGVISLALARDGKRLYSGSQDRTIKLWEGGKESPG